jgi:hypothetical protein
LWAIMDESVLRGIISRLTRPMSGARPYVNLGKQVQLVYHNEFTASIKKK